MHLVQESVLCSDGLGGPWRSAPPIARAHPDDPYETLQLLLETKAAEREASETPNLKSLHLMQPNGKLLVKKVWSAGLSLRHVIFVV